MLVVSRNGVVRGIDPDGTVKWRYDAPNGLDGGGPGSGFVVHKDRLLVATGEDLGTGGADYAVRALDPATGERAWTYSLGGGWTGVLGAIAGGVAIGEGDDAIGPNDNVTALVECDGTLRWKAETGDANAVADGGGRVYVGAYGVIRGFDADTGERAWRVDAMPNYLGLAADDATLYAVEDGDEDAPPRRVVARAGESGERLWAGDWFATSLYRHGADGVVVGGKRLVSLAPDGSERWEYSLGGSAYGPAGEGALFTGPGSDVAAVSLSDGGERWRASVDAPSAYPRAYGDGVLVSEYLEGGRFFAHDAATGEVRWSLDVSGDRPPGVVVGADTAFVASNDGRLLARDL